MTCSTKRNILIGIGAGIGAIVGNLARDFLNFPGVFLAAGAIGAASGALLAALAVHIYDKIQSSGRDVS